MRDQDLLGRAGVALFGERWRRPLARLLYTVSGRAAGERTLRRAAAGGLPVPAWWWGALAGLLEQRAAMGQREGELELARALRERANLSEREPGQP